MSATPAIDIRSLRVDYGDFVAVDDLTLTVPPGEVFGLVGPNGAGKTSTFRVLTTLMEPTYGEVILDGVDVLEDIESARRIIGYMPDLAPVPSDLKVWEFLDFHAAAYGLGNRAQRRERVAECLEEVALTDQRDSWCKELSRGQTQRVVLAKTLLHRPRVLILDEPASGLDPLARRDLRQRAAETRRHRRHRFRQLPHPQRTRGNVLLAVRDEPRETARIRHRRRGPRPARQHRADAHRQPAQPPRGSRRLVGLRGTPCTTCGFPGSR